MKLGSLSVLCFCFQFLMSVGFDRAQILNALRSKKTVLYNFKISKKTTCTSLSNLERVGCKNSSDSQMELGLPPRPYCLSLKFFSITIVSKLDNKSGTNFNFLPRLKFTMKIMNS